MAATRVTSDKIAHFNESEFFIVDQLLDFVFVTMLLSVHIKACSHGGDKMATSFQGCVDIIHSSWWHVVRHEYAGGAGAVVFIFEFFWVLIHPVSQEKYIEVGIPVLGSAVRNELLGGVDTVNVGVALLVKHVSDLSSAAADIQDVRVFGESKVLLQVNLLDNLVFLCEIYQV